MIFKIPMFRGRGIKPRNILVVGADALTMEESNIDTL